MNMLKVDNTITIRRYETLGINLWKYCAHDETNPTEVVIHANKIAKANIVFPIVPYK